MWYYKQDFIRKSVWSAPILKQNLQEVIDWLESMASATHGDPLPSDCLQQVRQVFAHQCRMIEAGHVSGRVFSISS